MPQSSSREEMASGREKVCSFRRDFELVLLVLLVAQYWQYLAVQKHKTPSQSLDLGHATYLELSINTACSCPKMVSSTLMITNATFWRCLSGVHYGYGHSSESD